MKCLKCGEENRNDAGKCIKCNTPLLWTPDSEPNEFVKIKVSKLALIAISLTFLGLILIVIGFMSPYTGSTFRYTHSIKSAFFLSSLIIFVLAIILGIASWMRIEMSGGLKTGTKLSVGAILISILGTVFLIALPALSRAHNHPIKLICGTNFAGLGKAMLIYANDYDDELPRAGGLGATWGTSVKWDASNQQEAFGLNQNRTGGSATISSSLYLLVKYAEVTPKSFICKGSISEGKQFGGDKGVSEFRPSRNQDLYTLWDFGPQPWLHNSYAYHMPYGANALSTSSNPGMAVAADRNPWMPSSGWTTRNPSAFNPNGDKTAIKNGNTFCHQDEGQNVLYLDSHVEFQSVSFCGINQDNIYTSWNGGDIRKGIPPEVGSQPASNTDSLLVNDPPAQNH